jgi:ribosomal protein S27E
VAERYLDCGNPRCGFARIRCPDCHAEHLLMFSCRTRGFCPSCHSKRLEEWGEWMREELLLDVPHRQVVFTIPRMLRIFFKYNRRLLGELCRLALRSLTRYFEVTTGSELMPGVIAAIQTFGNRMNLHPHLHFLVTEGGVDGAGLFHKIPRIDDSPILSARSSSARHGQNVCFPGGTRGSMSTAGSGPRQRPRPSGWANT